MNTKVAFGGLIAIVLLGLYGYAVFVACTSVVTCVATAGCTTVPAASFNDGMAQVMATIGALISAFVIAELALTKPGQSPGARVIVGTSSTPPNTAEKVVGLAYLVVWLALGVYAVVVGVMLHPKMLQPLTDLGQSWLGLAVMAAYTYFGIKPS
jgi:hypothetical protein